MWGILNTVVMAEPQMVAAEQYAACASVQRHKLVGWCWDVWWETLLLCKGAIVAGQL
jgi:hypothetical protein